MSSPLKRKQKLEKTITTTTTKAKNKKTKERQKTKNPLLVKKGKQINFFFFGLTFINIGPNFGILWASYLLSCKISHIM